MRTFLGGLTQWSNRSMAALLLCIHCVDDKPVISYFKHLSSNDQIGMAMDILSNVFHLASVFIPSRNLVISWYHIVRACLTVLITFRTTSDSVIDPCSTWSAMLLIVVGGLRTDKLWCKSSWEMTEWWLSWCCYER